jgi:hypothetical protein
MSHPMSKDQVKQFIAYLDDRIKKHNENLDRCFGYSDDRTLIKTERAEAQVIRNAFLNILAPGRRR